MSSKKIKLEVIGAILLVVVLLFGWFTIDTWLLGSSSYSCYSEGDCIQKDGQCTIECLHTNQKPTWDQTISCEYRPWFHQERCECIENKCTKITCEDLELDFTECNELLD